ncbi:hypothetical protein ACQPYK_02795 [Streptosporangium sp. CA-135522]|uniref:hypothetical protein n=1 Tax=Streptosporangium sp. CA-135522 TaxID=3240072 RepID=UPI003D8B1274
MTTVRRLIAVAVIAPIVSVSVVLAAPGPAQAVARLDVPSRVTSNQAVTLSGTVDPLFDAVLFVNGRQVAKGDRKVSYSWDPRDRPNGSYEIRLEQKGKILGGEWHQTSETLTQAVPPAPPSGVAARLQGDHAVVTWNKGAEPDLQGYEISTSQTGKVGSVQVGSACSGGSCRATLSVPAKAAGQRIGFMVQALRSNGNGGTLSSGESAVVSIRVPAPGVPQNDQSTDTQKGAETRDSADQQKTGKNPTSDQQGRKSGGKKADKRQSGIQDLPRLPARKPTTAPTRSPKSAVVPARRPGLSETVRDKGRDSETVRDKGGDRGKDKGANKVARPPAKRNDKGIDTKGRAEAEPESAADSMSTGTDTMPATKTDIMARSSESPVGGISQYGIFIAGALILLLLGAHGGAWFRRKLLAAHTSGGQAVATDFDPSDDDTPKIASKMAGNIRTSASGSFAPATAAPATAASTASAVRRPAVILAVVKTRDFQQGSAHSASVRPSSVRRVSTHSPVQPLSAPHASALAREASPDRVPERPDTCPEAESGASGSGVRGPAVISRSEPSLQALPVAAPIPEVRAVAPIAVRIGDRWDDYLPPAPRSMEDSGFWERPQPGATDFWAADEEDPSYPGGRRDGGD